MHRERREPPDRAAFTTKVRAEMSRRWAARQQQLAAGPRQRRAARRVENRKAWAALEADVRRELRGES